MAQSVTVQLIDDLDQSLADETVQFGLDGAIYEIDLNKVNADQMRQALAKYLIAARKTRRGVKTKTAKTSGIKMADVRVWAQQQGIEVSNRGRIPGEIVDRYEAAH